MKRNSKKTTVGSKTSLIMILLTLTLSMLLVAAQAYGAARSSLIGSKHDFSTVDNPDACGFCHARIKGAHLQNIPQWDKNTAKNNNYIMYSSPSMKTRPDSSPSNASLACLGCHDGTLASAVGNTHSSSNIGPDLSNDHPISMFYPTRSQNRGFRTPPDPLKGWNDVKLIDGKVECASCHDPHNPSKGSFLRMANAGSALCLKCHIK